MAQATETKISTEAGESNEQAGRDESMRKAVRQSMASEQSFGRAGVAAARQGGEAVQQTTEAMKASTEATKEAAQRSMRELADGQRELLETAAGRFEAMSRRMASAAAEMAEDLRSFMLIPSGQMGDLRHFQDGVSGLVGGVVQTNLKMAQELMRISDPMKLFELQQRIGREYMGALMLGTGAFIRVAREATEQTLRPMEERIEQRCRQLNGGEHRAAAE
jgi:hypothetical protein